jgi:hypothetical protein
MTDFVDRADVRVVQRGGVAGFMQETASSGVVVGVFTHDLEGDGTTERGIVGEKDGTHPAATELAVDAIASQRGTRLVMGEPTV